MNPEGVKLLINTIKTKLLKLLIIKCLLPLFMLLTTIVSGQVDITSIHYRGIRPDDRSGLLAIRNPGRGFMINDTIDLSVKSNLFNIKLASNSNLNRQLLKYAADSTTLVHTTLYLPAAQNEAVADFVLKGMQFYFDSLHMMGMKCVLHLTYKAAPGSAKGPKPADVLLHKNQFLPLLIRNKDVVQEVQEGLMGSWSLGKDGMSDGYKAAIQLRLNQLNALSLVVNNGNVVDPKKFSMDHWRNVPVDPDQLLTDKMPFSEDYFKSSAGNIVQRPLFDYIRDHLGYRIELQQLMLPAKRPDNSPIHLKLELTNRGFSAVKQPCSVAFVLIDPTGKVYELPAEGDPASWQPFASGDVSFKPVIFNIEYKGKLPLHLIPGKYKLGVWIADASVALHYDYRYDIRCANGNTGWWISRDGKYGINVLTSLTISK